MIRPFCISLGLAAVGAVTELDAQMVGGQVIDEHGRPIRGVVVHLLDSALTVIDSVNADSVGTFYLTASRAGKYVLRVSASGLLPAYSRPFSVAGGEFHQERIALEAVPNARVYFDFEVHEQVTPVPGNRPPQYPMSLRASHVQGEVRMQFVVDTSGRAVLGTTKVLRSSHEEFTKAVLLALPSFRFNPARIDGRAVAQMVQMPFQFYLAP